jgi:hypothetical protein
MPERPSRKNPRFGGRCSRFRTSIRPFRSRLTDLRWLRPTTSASKPTRANEGASEASRKRRPVRRSSGAGVIHWGRDKPGTYVRCSGAGSRLRSSRNCWKGSIGDGFTLRARRRSRHAALITYIILQRSESIGQTLRHRRSAPENRGIVNGSEPRLRSRRAPRRCCR